MRLVLALLLLVVGNGVADESVKPIRGPVPIPETNSSDSYRTEKHDRYIPRNHRWQPPVIPHHIKGYQITRNVNTCLACHSSAASAQTGARPVAESHYVDRDGRKLPNVSTRRYFCLQCHAPQYDAEPLIGNTFAGPK